MVPGRGELRKPIGREQPPRKVVAAPAPPPQAPAAAEEEAPAEEKAAEQAPPPEEAEIILPGHAHQPVPQPAVAMIPVRGVAGMAHIPYHGALGVPPADYGGAYSVDIGSQAPVWRGSAIALGLFALRFGSIQVDQTATTIRVTKRSKGDSNKIAKFIKRVFRLGGHLNGVKMTSQRLTRHIIAKLPGTFAISA